MAARFIGRYEHSLDAKGRIVLPARFRADFEARAFASQYTDGCVALWTPEEFTKQLEEKEQQQGRSAVERNVARLWAAGSSEVEIDRSGRVAIPPYLRDFAHLDGNVLVIGAIDRVELWNPDEWSARVVPATTFLVSPQEEPASPPA